MWDQIVAPQFSSIVTRLKIFLTYSYLVKLLSLFGMFYVRHYMLFGAQGELLLVIFVLRQANFLKSGKESWTSRGIKKNGENRIEII